MDPSDDEKSDEWVESFDSMGSDDGSDNEGPAPALKLMRKSKSKKRIAVAAESEESSADSDRVSSDSADETQTGDGQDSKLKSNPAWANAMSKVLRSTKSVGKKAVVLSKAKKVADAKEKKPKLDFEIVNANAEETAHEADDVKEDKPNLKKKLLMKEYLVKGRTKPSVLDRDHERTLMKIATKGVVQLFNAVRQQQKTVDKTIKKAGKSEQKREKMLETIDKKKFLDVLTGSIKNIPSNEKIKVEENGEENNSWGVLRDDFMMGTKLKDWDKNEEVI